MANMGSKGIQGPLFEEDGPDLLDLVAHLLDLNSKQAIGKMWGGTEKTQRWVNSLLLLDIARSLRKISTAKALHTTDRVQRSKFSG